MFILMIIGLLGLIFSLCIILYFTSKGVIGDPKGYDKLEDVDMLDELSVSSSDKETHTKGLNT